MKRNLRRAGLGDLRGGAETVDEVGGAQQSRARPVRVHRRPLTGSTAGKRRGLKGAGGVEKK
jgi:hypothetical protein